MDMWRKMKIANGALAVVAVALSVVACYLPNAIYWAMWAWTFALWMFVDIVAIPVINTNRQKHNLLANSLFFITISLAVLANIWLGDHYPATDGFSRDILVYAISYAVVAFVMAGWLKLREKQKRNKINKKLK